MKVEPETIDPIILSLVDRPEWVMAKALFEDGFACPNPQQYAQIHGESLAEACAECPFLAIGTTSYCGLATADNTWVQLYMAMFEHVSPTFENSNR